MEKINVTLYGGKSIFGGKETKLEAVTLYCDKCETCSLYKEGKCLNLRSFGGAWCKFGKSKKEEGYTSRAQKYYSWKKKFTDDPTYGKLKYPNETYIAKIDNFIFINTGYLHRDKDTGKFRVEAMLFGGGYEFVPEEEFFARLPDIAKNAVADACTGSNPRQPSVEEMEKLLKCCYYDTEVDF